MLLRPGGSQYRAQRHSRHLYVWRRSVVDLRHGPVGRLGRMGDAGTARLCRRDRRHTHIGTRYLQRPASLSPDLKDGNVCLFVAGGLASTVYLRCIVGSATWSPTASFQASSGVMDIAAAPCVFAQA